jgi:hypothetical protein
MNRGFASPSTAGTLLWRLVITGISSIARSRDFLNHDPRVSRRPIARDLAHLESKRNGERNRERKGERPRPRSSPLRICISVCKLSAMLLHEWLNGSMIYVSSMVSPVAWLSEFQSRDSTIVIRNTEILPVNWAC